MSILINRAHETIKFYIGRLDPYVTIMHNRQLFFSSGLCKLFNINGGSYIHFLNDGKSWMFFTNNDPDGFLANRDSKHNKGVMSVQIFSTGLIVMIGRSTGINTKMPVNYPVEETGIENDGRPVYRIRFDTPIEKTKKWKNEQRKV